MSSTVTPVARGAKTSFSKSATSTAAVQPTAQHTDGALPAAHPIHPLSSPLARAVSHTHTFAIPLLFIARFAATVADPVASLTALLAPLAAAQLAYCVLSLPPTENVREERTVAAPKRKTGERVVKERGAGRFGSRIVTALLSLLLSIIVIPLVLALLILTGAPLTTHLEHTALLAAHISLLAALPLFYTHGVQSVPWRQLVSLAAPFDEGRGAAAGAVLGAWLGAIPIPLDWDREWQRWPVTVVAGVYAGWCLGKAAGGTVGFGRIVNFE